MIPVYNDEEIKLIRESCRVAREACDVGHRAMAVGVTTEEIDR